MSKKKSRRDFIVIASYSMGAVGAGAAIWPIINQMNPGLIKIITEKFDKELLEKSNNIYKKMQYSRKNILNK